MEWLAGLAIVFILGLSLGLGLLVVALVRREGSIETDIGWEDAERVARRDVDEGTRDGAGTDGDGGNDRRT